ncbi:50S ribosomal protein L16 [Candidatus Woesearchaeota archaeon]|nr:50S ribosomal protein L16 [Candidatus Woesearchaeota archaeon]
MARIRKGVSYRPVKRAYTRYSKFKNKSFVKTRPVCRVVRFDMGNVKREYDYVLHLVSKQTLQIRDNALESARLAGNRVLEKNLGKDGFHLRVRKFPHHILRENPLAAGAGADRMSTGMAHSFGKIIGIAAQVKEGHEIFTLKVKKENLPIARKAMKKISLKLPKQYSISENKIKEKTLKTTEKKEIKTAKESEKAKVAVA